MKTGETCPNCGAERPSWLGGSHRRTDGTRLCNSGVTADEYWQGWLYQNRITLRHWPVA